MAVEVYSPSTTIPIRVSLFDGIAHRVDKTVECSIVRESDGHFWNGSTWQAAEIQLTMPQVDKTSVHWVGVYEYGFVVGPEEGFYDWQSTFTDADGWISVTRGTIETRNRVRADVDGRGAADIEEVDGSSTAATNLSKMVTNQSGVTMRLDRLEINNPAGNALVIKANASGDRAVLLQGATAGSTATMEIETRSSGATALRLDGSADGRGLWIVGMQAVYVGSVGASPSDHGMVIEGGSNASALQLLDDILGNLSGSVTNVTNDVTTDAASQAAVVTALMAETVDGVTYRALLECVQAVLYGEAEIEAPSVVVFKKRDGSTVKCRVTYGAEDGSRTDSEIV